MEATKTKAKRSRATTLPKASTPESKQADQEKEAFLYHAKISASRIFSKHL